MTLFFFVCFLLGGGGDWFKVKTKGVGVLLHLFFVGGGDWFEGKTKGVPCHLGGGGSSSFVFLLGGDWFEGKPKGPFSW